MNVDMATHVTRGQVLELFVEFIERRRGWILLKTDSIGPIFNAALCRQDLETFLRELEAADDAPHRETT